MRIPRSGPCRECDRPIQSQGLCGKHYKRALSARLGRCSVDGCMTSQSARGMCGLHYKRWRTENTSDRCEKCERPAVYKKHGLLCDLHYKQVQASWLPTCSVKGCERRSAAAGLCGRHRPGYRLRGLTVQERTDYFDSIEGRCDLCGQAVEPSRIYIDHDHAHCASGCRECVRGFLCAACNTFEGAAMGIQRRTSEPVTFAPLARYLAAAPLAKWLRERDAQKDAPLAA